jgi:hypothetical protein
MWTENMEVRNYGLILTSRVLLIHMADSRASDHLLIINPQRMPHTSFASPKCGIIRFFMAFQRHALCRFRWKRFVRQLWRYLQMLSFFTFPQATYNVLFIRKVMALEVLGMHTLYTVCMYVGNGRHVHTLNLSKYHWTTSSLWYLHSHGSFSDRNQAWLYYSSKCGIRVIDISAAVVSIQE